MIITNDGDLARALEMPTYNLERVRLVQLKFLELQSKSVWKNVQ
jgi:16S rRNA U516 pseudouridylate synthase RsuA-like enzyme